MGHRPAQRIQSFFAATLLLLSLGAIPSHASTKDDPVPPWVTEAAHQTLPTYSATTRAVVLLDQTEYIVAPNGTAVQHYRRVVKILRPNGRNRGIVRVDFDDDTRIRYLKVWSIGPDGHQYAMKDKEMADHGFAAEGGSLYDASKYREADPPARDPGSVIAYEYEQNIRPYLSEVTWGVQESIPVVQESFNLTLPPGYTYGTVWAHHSAAPVIELEHQNFRWELKDVPAIDLQDVPLAPAGGSLAGRMTIHYGGPGMASVTTGTWPSIGDWYQGLLRDRLTPTPEIAAKAQQLTAGKTDFFDKTEAIGEYVQNKVRYFVIELGIGGFQPHPVGQIFHNSYGDCKDKAALVSSMLQAVGIHATLVMVDTHRGVIDPDAPSIVGNHMIAAIEITAGYQSERLRSVVTAKTGRRYLIFDPTWELTSFGQLENNLQGSYGILLEGSTAEAIQLPILAPDRNSVHRNATLELKPDGTLSGTVTETRFGDLAEDHRRFYTMGDANEQRRYLDQILNRDLTDFSITDLKVVNAASLSKDFSMSFALSAEHFARPMGSLLMLRPRILGTDTFDLDRKQRKLPIDLRETMQSVDRFDIKLPPGYTIDELPAPVHLDLGFATYESASTLTGDTLHYTRTYTVKQITLPASSYTDLQHLASVINADEQNNAILTRK